MTHRCLGIDVNLGKADVAKMKNSISEIQKQMWSIACYSSIFHISFDYLVQLNSSTIKHRATESIPCSSVE